MKCEDVIAEIPLYCYGELSSEAEEGVESHIAACAACGEELRRHRALLDLLSARPDAADGALLASSRTRLRAALASEPAPGHTWLEHLRRFSQLHIPFRVPVGALALVALGFFAARVTPERFGGVRAGLAEPMFSNVRSVEPDPSGGVQIAVDEVRRHVVSGALRDPRIQELLLSAAREESNPGVRVESIGVLKESADSREVRQALVDALTRDPNPQVRLKALDGLKSWAGDGVVRSTLAGVLLHDDDPAVRVQAIDVLTAHHDDSIVGLLQDVVRKEDDSYVRARTTRLLETMRASVGTY